MRLILAGLGATMTTLSEPFARRICEQAITEGRCAEMIECLFDGGSVTLQGGMDGALVLVSASVLSAINDGANTGAVGPE